MIVAPAPIIALLLAAQALEVAILVMPFHEPHAIRASFSIVPGMIVRAIVVVITRVRRASTRQNRRKHGCAKHKGPQKSLYSQHFAILLRILSCHRALALTMQRCL